MQRPTRVSRPIAPPTVRRLTRALLRAFRRTARDLPWRRTRDPYAIWISEIMLQQTLVRTVIPYWERWMRTLPTIEALARARPSRVLKLWEGLGYYRRARHLHAAAKFLVRDHGGRFPTSFADVLALPGVGRYTAGAICSLAYNQPTPVLDGNVTRVLSRLFGLAGDPKSGGNQRRLWSLAEQLAQTASEQPPRGRRNCGDLNEALMELGAVLCTPRQPRCPECPVRRDCASALLPTHRLPRSRNRTPVVPKRVVVAVIEQHGRFLVCQRPDGVVNEGLWEFPNCEVSRDGHAVATALRRLGVGKRQRPAQLLRLKHSITRYRITLEAFRCSLPNRAARSNRVGRTPARSCRVTPAGAHTRARWCSLAQLRRLAFPSAHRRIVEHLQRETAGASSRPGHPLPGSLARVLAREKPIR